MVMDVVTITAADFAALPASDPDPVYRIPSHRIRLFEERFAALVRRARKLGCDEPTYTIGEVVVETRRVEDLDGEVFHEHVEFYPVTVAGAAPRFRGWTFLAVVEYEAEVPTFRKTPAAGDADLPLRFRSLGPVCEHCNASRQRKETFIVAHEDGRTVQVGRQCIRDFLGGNTPENVAALAAFESEVHASCSGEDGGFMGEPPFCPEVGAFLAWVVWSINRWGWVSRRMADDDGIGLSATATTASVAFEKYVKACKEGRGDRSQKPGEVEKARAAEVLTWARTLGDGEDRPLSDYEHNLKAIASLGRVSHKHFGLVASAVAAFDREVARRKAVLNEHVGAVGERLRGVRVFVDRVRATNSAYGTSVVSLRDLAGHVFVWFTTRVPDTGREYTMDATVREHGEWKGTLQTVVTRAELQADDEPTKAEIRHAETLDAALYSAAQLLTWEPIRWGGWDAFSARRTAAAKDTNLVELEALRAELHDIAQIVEPEVEPADDAARRYIDRVRRLVRARLAVHAPDFKRRSLKTADRARAHLLADRIRKAVADVTAWPLSYREASQFADLAEATPDDIRGLEALCAEMRAYVEPLAPKFSDEKYASEAAKLKADALAALDVGALEVPKGANPTAAKRIHRALTHEALWALGRWFEARDVAEAFRARADAALEQSDAVALTAIRDEVVALVPTLPHASSDVLYVAGLRTQLLAMLVPAAKKPAKGAAEAAPASA